MSSQSIQHPPADITPVTVNRDEEHLRLLSFYHFVMAIIVALGVAVFVVLPLLTGKGAAADMSKATPFLVQAGLFVLLYVMNGLALKDKRNRISCLLMSVAECVPFPFSFPLATILGVSAIIVLQRESVKALFAANKQP